MDKNKFYIVILVILSSLKTQDTFAQRKISQVNVIFNSGTPAPTTTPPYDGLSVATDITVHNIGNIDQHVSVQGGYFIRYTAGGGSDIFSTPNCPFYFLNGQSGVVYPDTTTDTSVSWAKIPPDKMANFHIRFPPESPQNNCNYTNILGTNGATVASFIGHGIVRFDIRVFEDKGAVNAGAFIRQDSDKSDQMLVPINGSRAF